MIGRAVFLAGVFAIAGTPLFAHPHSNMDQQVALTLDVDRIMADIVIVPSVEAGPDILARLDQDADGVITEAEGRAFAQDVLAATQLQVSGDPAPLTVTGVMVAPAAALRDAMGSIAITAEAAVSIDPASATDVSFQIGFEEFSHDWFVQPYLSGDSLGSAVGAIDRAATGAVRITFIQTGS